MPLLSCLIWGIAPGNMRGALEAIMSDHSEETYTVADGMDYPAHERTYALFLALVKYTTLTLIATMALMAYFLV